MNLIDISKEVAIEMFPSETWTEEYKNVFVASSRVPKNSEQQKVFEKENVYIKIDSHISEKRVRQILHGVLKGKSNSGLVYCYITDEKTMHYWRMDDLK